MEPDVLWNYFCMLGGPVVGFVVGVIICIYTKLYDDRNLKPGHICLMALPVGFLTLGILISETSVTVSSESSATVKNTTYCAYMESFTKYMIFCAITAFYGTLVPEMFVIYRKTLIRFNS